MRQFESTFLKSKFLKLPPDCTGVGHVAASGCLDACVVEFISTVQHWKSLAARSTPARLVESFRFLF